MCKIAPKQLSKNTSRLICLHLFDILYLNPFHSGIFKCDLRDQMLFGVHCVLEFNLTVTEEAKSVKISNEFCDEKEKKVKEEV